MIVVAAFRDLASTWGSFYANHAAMRTVIAFAHVGGLVAAGGASMMADREILSAYNRREQSAPVVLSTVHKTHGVVLAGLTVVIASGVLLFAADLDTYLWSKLFWIKMALVVALMINGAVLTRAARHVSSNRDHSWETLQWTAIASLSLWFLTTFIGTALPNIG
jgi:amino acid transporter